MEIQLSISDVWNIIAAFIPTYKVSRRRNVMARIILAVIVGFFAWSVMWIGSDQVLIMLSPGWYGAHQLGFAQAMEVGSPFTADATILAMHIVRAIIISLLSGYLAAVIAGENRKAPLWLGVALLLFGLAVEIAAWNYAPAWYHLIFLALLIPVTVLGGRLKSYTAQL
jgi:hypothetical protein